MAIRNSDDIKVNKERLAQAEKLQKEIENIDVWIADLTNNVAVPDSIRLYNDTTKLYLVMDRANYTVDSQSKQHCLELLNNKKLTLEQMVQTLLTTVDQDIP